MSTPLVPSDKLRKEDDSGAAAEAQYRKVVGSLVYLNATRPDIIDWSGSEDVMSSTSGYAFTFGSGMFSWASVKQHCIALSTAEAENINAEQVADIFTKALAKGHFNHLRELLGVKSVHNLKGSVGL
ncbi:hypothetical protein ACFX13_023257 [Malus domestica]